MPQYTPFFDLKVGSSPIIGAAIHHGHKIRPELEGLFAISEAQRLREEDPYTGEIATVCATHVIVRHSRFEVDLNRPRDACVYLTPEQAWGLDVWHAPPDEATVAQSLREYDSFYQTMETFIRELVKRHQFVSVLDIHSYNHRRNGPDDPHADPEQNPEVNIGTGTVPSGRWRELIDRFIGDLRSYDGLDHSLDVRENIKFRGGNFVRWLHNTFPDSVCALAVEFRKDFMNEWTGEPHVEHIGQLQLALSSTLAGLNESLRSARRAAATISAGRYVS